MNVRRRELAGIGRYLVCAALAVGLAAASGATELPCGALSVADITGLGYVSVQEGYATSWRSNVSLDSHAAIFGREADCVWHTPYGTVTLTVGEMDTNVVKGDAVTTLAKKVLASVQTTLKEQEPYTGKKWAVSPLPGVGEEAFTARMNDLFFEVLGYQGPRVARLQVSATAGTPGKPTPEKAGVLLAKALTAGTEYSSAGAAPAEHAWGAEEEGDRYIVTGSLAATGSLTGTFVWNSPNAVELYPDRIEIVLNTADKSAFMNLQVFRADGRVQVRSGKLPLAKLVGAGGRSTVDVLKGAGSIAVESTVSAATGEKITLRGTLTIRPNQR